MSLRSDEPPSLPPRRGAHASPAQNSSLNDTQQEEARRMARKEWEKMEEKREKPPEGLQGHRTRGHKVDPGGRPILRKTMRRQGKDKREDGGDNSKGTGGLGSLFKKFAGGGGGGGRGRGNVGPSEASPIGSEKTAGSPRPRHHRQQSDSNDSLYYSPPERRPDDRKPGSSPRPWGRVGSLRREEGGQHNDVDVGSHHGSRLRGRSPLRRGEDHRAGSVRSNRRYHDGEDGPVDVRSLRDLAPEEQIAQTTFLEMNKGCKTCRQGPFELCRACHRGWLWRELAGMALGRRIRTIDDLRCTACGNELKLCSDCTLPLANAAQHDSKGQRFIH